jgi:hypothetical protein
MIAESTSMNRSSRMLAFAAALALSALSACAPEVPAAPTYTKDVAPILNAHCVRCHGAGGTLNAYPFPVYGSVQAPATCYLQTYDNAGDCTTPGTTTCQLGAKTCAGMIVAVINQPVGSVQHMPPPPSDPLNDWEKDVLSKWLTASPPAPQ